MIFIMKLEDFWQTFPHFKSVTVNYEVSVSLSICIIYQNPNTKVLSLTTNMFVKIKPTIVPGLLRQSDELRK